MSDEGNDADATDNDDVFQDIFNVCKKTLLHVRGKLKTGEGGVGVLREVGGRRDHGAH